VSKNKSVPVFVFFLTREVAKRCMIPRKSGKVINIASIAGLSGNPEDMKTIAYNTSKGANVNSICPGFFPSKMSQGLLYATGDQMMARIPLNRFGGEEDIKGLAALLASEAGRHITGQNIAVYGGTTAA
jgi:gluconate 5-dehydrogenase